MLKKRLSGGRMVFGAGLGGDSRRELTAFGEERDPRARAALLDEALDVVLELWTGATVSRDGPVFALDTSQVRPTPLQQPLPPVWLGCVWPHRRPLVRAARYDGVFPVSHEAPLTGDDVRAILETVDVHRAAGAVPFDLVGGQLVHRADVDLHGHGGAP